MKCKDCIYLIKGTNRCHRYPPVNDVHSDIHDKRLGKRIVSSYWSFPLVDSDEWCGEFKVDEWNEDFERN